MTRKRSPKNQNKKIKRDTKNALAHEERSGWLLMVAVSIMMFIIMSVGDLIGYNRTTGISKPISTDEYFSHIPIIISISVVLGVLAKIKKL